MAFAKDLLAQSFLLLNKETKNPKQASLRRAVSTAHYALFHLLIDEAVSQWAVERQRNRLARTFEHDGMKRKCAEVVKRVKDGTYLPVELNTVAHNFVQLQELRHIADYDNSMRWSRADVNIVLTLATDAFDAWSAIGAQDDAQDFLLQLLFPKLPRQ